MKVKSSPQFDWLDEFVRHSTSSYVDFKFALLYIFLVIRIQYIY